MSFKSLIIVLTCVLSCFSAGWAAEVKIYVPQDSIAVDLEGVFIYTDGGWLPVESLYEDEDGYYILVADEWRCPRCDRMNEHWRSRCKACGGP